MVSNCASLIDDVTKMCNIFCLWHLKMELCTQCSFVHIMCSYCCVFLSRDYTCPL